MQERKTQMLDFRIETFLEVCKDMNFTHAANRLNMTQPAVSQHIRWLEENYGVPLFEAQGKKMRLTPAGELLKTSAATMQHDIFFLKEKMQESSKRRRKLKMGLTLTIAEFEISGCVASFLNQDKTASMLFSVGNTKKLLHELEDGTIDFALVEGNFPKEIYHHELYTQEPYIAVCSAKSPLSKGRWFIDDLLSQRLITREPGSGTRSILERYLETKSLEVNSFSALIEAGNIDLIKQLVESGCGITFLYRTAVKKELEEGRLCEIQMKDMNIVHDFTFIWRENSIFNEDYRRFYEMLKNNKKQMEERS